MRRGVAIGTTAVALALAPVAIGIGVGDYHGNVKGDPGSTITFDVVRTDGGKKVKRFISNNVDFTCTARPPGETEAMRILATFRVNQDREFKGKGEAVGIPADPFGRVTGKFKRGGKAVGTLRLTGELDGSMGSDCSTGVVEWRAEKTGL